MTDKPDRGKLEFWAILELFGHTKIAGYLQEVSLGGDVMLRVDVPEVKFDDGTIIPAFTKFYSPKAVFAATPTTEESARLLMASLRVRPIEAFDIRRALPAPPAPRPTDYMYEETGEDVD